MPSIITQVGRDLIAQKQAASEILTIEKVVLYNTPVGGASPTMPLVSSVLPDITDYVFEVNLTKQAYINPNAVVYSLLLDTSVGDFDFTWMGWIAQGGELFAISHTTEQFKRKDGLGQQGNSFTRNLVVEFTGAQDVTQIVVPAETWQLDFSDRLNLIEKKAGQHQKALWGRSLFLGDAFKSSAITPILLAQVEDATGWSTSGSGVLTADVDFIEGAGSVKLTGHALSDTLDYTFGITENLSSFNGLFFWLKSLTEGGAITFYVEDIAGGIAKWDLTSQTFWKKHEIKLESPDHNTATPCDMSQITKMGFLDLVDGTSYFVDNFYKARFNDFTLASGLGLVEGEICEIFASSSYETNLVDWQGAGTPLALAPPISGTRTDFVYLDMVMWGDFNGKSPRFALEVSADGNLTDYLDGQNYQHYRVKIASLERTTSELIETVIDLRTNLQHNPETGLLIALVDAVNGLTIKGGVDASTNPNYPVAEAGWLYKVQVAGKIGGANGVQVAIGDSLICLSDNTPSGDQITVGDAWMILQSNNDIATTTDIQTATDNSKMVTPKIFKDGLDFFMPVGVIFPWVPGHFTGAENLGFTLGLGLGDNTVAEANIYLNPRGLFICDGTAPNEPLSPIWNTAGRFLPHLTDDRFLMGSTVSGEYGGSNTMLDHTHTHSLSINASGSHGHTININGAFVYQGSTGGVGANNQNNDSGFNTGGQRWLLDNVAHTHTNSDFAGTIGANSAASATSILPKFLSCFYIIKVV